MRPGLEAEGVGVMFVADSSAAGAGRVDGSGERTAVARKILYTYVSGSVPKGMPAHGCVANPLRARPHERMMAGTGTAICSFAEAVAAARLQSLDASIA